MLMTALVTGAGGFLGQYLVEQLIARGQPVRTLSRKSYPALARLGVDMREGDLRDAETVHAACQDVDVVYHAAGVAGIWGSWEHYHGINTVGTKHVVAACQDHGVPRLVYTSSPSVTFDGSHQRNIDETVAYPDRWLCHYPHTKALGEQLALAANSETLATCALRPHLIWGPRDNHLIPRLISRAQTGQLRIVGDGQNLVDMVYVENAAEAHLQAADALTPGAPVCGRAYFITQGEPVNCWQWINEILALAELDPVTKRIGFATAWRLGATLECLWKLLGKQDEPRMTRFLAAQLARDHYFDITRAREDFGYTPRISTEVGMQRLAEWIGEGMRC